MEGFLPILFLWGLFAVVSSIAKKAQKTQQKTDQAAKKIPAPRPQSASQQRRPQPAQPVQPVARPSVQPPVHSVSSHTAVPLEAHMHEPEMGEEGVGTEGIDCCHEYMLNMPEEPESGFLPMTETDQQERSRALLQGVIFSEILGRRPRRRCGGRRA